MTPPAAPNGPPEILSSQNYHYLRVLRPFDPEDLGSDKMAVLPLKKGEVVLIHSTHQPGWIAGTCLISGRRGWLPANLCKAYDPRWLRTLLNAAFNIEKLLRSCVDNEKKVFWSESFVKGIDTGVKDLLEKSSCSKQDSPMLQKNEELSKCRIGILSDLTELSNTAKELQSTASHKTEEVLSKTFESMLLKAFMIVNKGVHFLDVFEKNISTQQPAATTQAIDRPPTPLVDLTPSEKAEHQTRQMLTTYTFHPASVPPFITQTCETQPRNKQQSLSRTSVDSEMTAKAPPNKGSNKIKTFFHVNIKSRFRQG